MADLHKTSRIEGGIDAVIIGDAPDALAAAALLARSGLHVVLVDDKSPEQSEKREIAPGYFAETGDPIVRHLDTRLIDALDLYRQGLGYRARRLETIVSFGDGAFLHLPGDPSLHPEAIAEFSEADAEPFASWWEAARSAGRVLHGWVSGDDDAPRAMGPDEILLASVDGILTGRFKDARIDDYLRAEAIFGGAQRPSEAFSYLALVNRFSGEVAGLQGALGFVDGSGRGVERALLQACNAYGVSIRNTVPVKSVIVEGDRVAGVDFTDGSQIRTSIVVTAQPAKEAFLHHVGRDKLDIEFTRILEIAPNSIARIRAHLAINGTASNARIASRQGRRIFLAPTSLQIEQDFRAARKGEAPRSPVAELVFPSAFDASLAPDGCSTAMLTLHPVANRAIDVEEWRELVSKCAREIFVRLAGEVEIAGVILEEPEPAKPALAEAVEFRNALFKAGGLEGYFFCGAEAVVGCASDLSAGRRAGARALSYFRKGS